MQDLADRYRAANRKGWLRSRSVLEHCSLPSEDELASLEQRVGHNLPTDMRAWLRAVGFCNIDDDLSFRPEWFRPVEQGHFKGAVLFAQDTLGNFFAFHPVDGSIIFFARSEPAYAVLAPSFRAFLEQLAERDFKVMEWVSSLTLSPYEWGAA